jgi:Mor family transcriptional regulator
LSQKKRVDPNGREVKMLPKKKQMATQKIEEVAQKKPTNKKLKQNMLKELS